MKRLLFTITAFILGSLTAIAEQLKVADIALVAGFSKNLVIELDNVNTNLVAFQMDLTLPEGFGIDRSECTLSSRITDDKQELTIGKREDNLYRLTSTSFALNPISGESGVLLTLKLTAKEGCKGGQAVLSNILFSTSNSEKLNLRDTPFTITALYKLTYKVDGEVLNTDTITYGTELTAEAAPTKEGYTFSGWSEIPETMPANDVVVTGTFTINSYTLSYKVDGEEYKSSTVVYGTALTPETAPTKEGHTFSGWSEIPETMPAQDVEVTGSFTINSYTLTYNVDGEEYKSSTVVYGTALTPETAPTREGYTFSGWSVIPETMPAQDVVVTGSFTINSYTLTYNVDGEEYKSSTVVYGTALTPETAPTREGYTFSGWSEIPETMPAQDVEITGTFTVNKYKVTFMYGNDVLKTIEVEFGAEIPLPESLEIEGYTLIEWLDVPETMPAQDITIYANYTTGIESIHNSQLTIDNGGIYSINGCKQQKLQRGINIVRTNNGTIRKVLVK